MRKRDLLLSTTVLGGTLAAAAPAMAADMRVPPPMPAPAVDGANWKLSGLGGTIANQSLAGGVGAYTFPLQGPYGVQIDGGAGSLGGSGWATVAGHLFWRDPSKALYGLYGSFTELDRFGGVRAGHVAGEGELYLGRYTVQGLMGVEFGNSVSTSNTGVIQTGIPFGQINTTITNSQGFAIKTRFFDQINLKYYLSDYFDAYVGHRYLGGKNAAAFGGEFSAPLGRGVLGSLFVEGRAGESAFHGIWGGVKLYFGPNDKSLIARHRTQDPAMLLETWDNLFTILNNANSSTNTTNQKVCFFGRPFSGGSCPEGGG
jgi:hypothetical protein